MSRLWAGSPSQNLGVEQVLIVQLGKLPDLPFETGDLLESIVGAGRP